MSTVLPSLLTLVLIHETWNVLSIFRFGAYIDLLFPIKGKAKMDSTSKLRIYGGLLFDLLLWPTL